MKKIRFLRDTNRPETGTTIQTPGGHPKIIRCVNNRLFRAGEIAKVPGQYLSGLVEGIDFQFLD